MVGDLTWYLVSNLKLVMLKKPCKILRTNYFQQIFRVFFFESLNFFFNDRSKWVVGKIQKFLKFLEINLPLVSISLFFLCESSLLGASIFIQSTNTRAVVKTLKLFSGELHQRVFNMTYLRWPSRYFDSLTDQRFEDDEPLYDT